MPGIAALTEVPGEPREFFDREDQLDSIVGHLEKLRGDSSYFKVVELCGYGGMGKTTLLKRARKIAADKDPPQRIHLIPLAAETGEIGTLLAIRNALELDCLMFDTALITYWSVTAPHNHQKGALASSFAMQSLQAGAAANDLPLPLAYTRDVYERGRRGILKARRYSPEDFERIEALRDTPDEIRELLPSYLAIDIARATRSGREIALFYDGYEKHDREERRAPWLKTFVETLGRGVHVIGTREPLDWKGQQWADAIESVDVDVLPDAESRMLIRSWLGRLEDPYEARLLDASKRIPFFLEAVINAYRLKAEIEKPRLEDLPSSPDGSVEHLLKHLSRDSRSLVVALATVQIFDREMFEHLGRELSGGSDALRFDAFVSRFFVEDVRPELHKTHDLLTDFVHRSSDEVAARRRTLEAATTGIVARAREDSVSPERAHDLLAMFSAVTSGWYSVDDPPERSVEAIVDAGYALFDAGHWNEVGAMPVLRPPDDAHPVSVAMELFAAIAARRAVGVDSALRRLENLVGRAEALGRHQRSAELELAYLRELAGDYPQARVEFQGLKDRIGRFEPSDRIHLRTYLYTADMQIMDGELLAGSRLLLETSETVDHESRVEWAELVRHRGHALRFSFLPDEASNVYREAMREVMDAAALRGKLHTNLAESLCWSDPHAALKEADLSTELNGRFGNRIELVKCDAARGVALAKLKRFKDATKAIGSAMRVAEEVGYPAGGAFALQARAIRKGLDRDTLGLEADLEALRDVVTSLGTYHHLLVAPMLLSGDARAFRDAAEKTEWLDPDGLEARLGRFLGG